MHCGPTRIPNVQRQAFLCGLMVLVVPRPLDVILR